ncbi:HAD-IA family hydrolase [Tundrisphaera sp. TA3]|uniref:HAD-IA family hydrolase n=1 Tax=Tundrisphaera sp. TA3 TaxID=3435775 RepID=UPI003EBCE24A
MADVPTLFFDVGGVLLTNGWDTGARKKAAETFGIDFEEFQARHEMLKTAFETGRHTLDHYIARAIFHEPRPFTADDFKAFMFDQSEKLGETLDFLRALAETGRYRLYTLNNESRELHEHRVEKFGLAGIFRGFLTSCYLGQAKPDEDIYLNALGIAACHRDHALFIDDRAMNVEVAQALGLNAAQFRGLDDLRRVLADRGVTA